MSTDWFSLAWVTSPLWLAVNALVAFRLTRLVVADMLPPLPVWRDRVERWAAERWQPEHARIFAEARLEEGPDAPPATAQEGELLARWQLYGGTPPLAYLVSCAWCAGFWVSLGVFLVAAALPTAVWAFLAVPLAFSAVTGLLHQTTE